MRRFTVFESDVCDQANAVTSDDADSKFILGHVKWVLGRRQTRSSPDLQWIWKTSTAWSFLPCLRVGPK
jgi:hypothetical protein